MSMREFEAASHSGFTANRYTEAETKAYTQQFGEITDGFRVAMQSGLLPADEVVQDLVRQHFEFCQQFWQPTRAAYVSLATSYLLPSPYRDAYENVAEGLGKFHYDAIVNWANQNLS